MGLFAVLRLLHIPLGLGVKQACLEIMGLNWRNGLTLVLSSRSGVENPVFETYPIQV